MNNIETQQLYLTGRLTSAAVYARHIITYTPAVPPLSCGGRVPVAPETPR
jgi:hypothetical protein